MEKQPMVSVIIPVYNVENYLRECLDSVVNQTLREIELICVDDGSTDGSGAVCEEYAARDARVQVIHKENGGQSSARNCGMDHACGEYVYFLDSDDYIDTDALERLYDLAEEKQLELIVFNRSVFFENAEMEKSHATLDYKIDYQNMPKEGISGCELFHIMLSQFYCCCVPLQFYRRELLQRSGVRFFDGIIHEDELFTPLILVEARRALCINNKYYHRRVRQASTMTLSTNENHYNGYFIAAAYLLAKDLCLPADETLKRETLLKRAKHLESVADNVFRKLSAEQKAHILQTAPEEYRFFFSLVHKAADGKALDHKAAAAIRASWSYRIGRAVTWLPRKVRGGVRCLRENGFSYTLRRVKEHIIGK